MAIEIDLSGRVALVTGGSRGLGRADALALAQAGADVAIADIQAESERVDRDGRCRRARPGGDGAGHGAHRVDGRGDARARAALPRDARCDVTDCARVNEAVDRVVEELGSVDILVNNAGTLDHVGQFADQRLDLWERDLRVNLTGAFNCAQAVWPHMRSASGGGS